jgi:integrase
LHLTALDNSSHTILCRLQELRDTSDVLGPQDDWSFINRISARIRARHKPARQKSRTIMSDELAQLGYELMDDTTGQKGLKAATSFRDGLMIALLAYVPIRRKNFAALVLGKSLIKRQGQWFVQLEPDQTKTHAWFETVLPQALLSHLDCYLDLHRPRLAAGDGRWQKPAGDALWISTHGSPLTQIAIYDRICRRTRERFGEHVSPHLFRDAAASTLATEAPNQVRMAAPLLGHRSFQTTEKYYRQAKAQHGHDQFVNVMDTLRRER